MAAYQDDDLLAVLLSASHTETSVRVDVALTTYGRDDAGRWQIEAFDPAAVLLPVGEDVGLEHYDSDHALLLPYLPERAHVSFTGRPNAAVQEVIGALYVAHAAIVGDHLPLGQYMNAGFGRDPQVSLHNAPAGFGTLTDLLEGGYGTLAHGPLPLIEAYAGVLSVYGFRVSVSEPRPAVRGVWHDDSHFSWDPIGDVGLLLLRRSTDQSGTHEEPGYVIAREFSARRV